MRSRAVLKPPHRMVHFVAAGGLVLGALALLAAPSGVAGAATGNPAITITPGSTNGKFSDGESVKVSVGPNSLFVPLSRVVILECADPGGDAANLPTSFSTCDGNTIQGNTTVVQSDGSFAEPNYSLYALPSKALGEQANWLPVCSPASECVLFVGENQNDFTQPKAFSRPFFMAASANPPATAATTPSATPLPSPASASVSASVSLSPTTLAFTGPSSSLMALAVLGAGLSLAGVLGARRIRRSGQ